jgi:hypothetical protein
VCKYKPDVKVIVCHGGVDREGFSLGPNTVVYNLSDPALKLDQVEKFELFLKVLIIGCRRLFKLV